jgi:multisubunit Na+/H+ antiporter MnhF subunit
MRLTDNLTPAPRTLDASAVLRSLARIDVRWAAIIGAAVVVLVGVPLAVALNIWIDEAFTLHTTGAGPIAAWTQAAIFEAQPPLYFVLEATWRTLNESSIAFARLPSVVFAAATVALIVGAAGRIAPRIPPLAVALVTALNPLVIWAAVEMRVYPLVFLVGAALAWTFYEGFLVTTPSRRARIGWFLVAIIGLYTQYYVGFLLAAQGLTVVALRRELVRDFAVGCVLIALAFVPILPTTLLHVRSSGQFVLPTTVFEAIRKMADAVFVVVLPHDVSWSGLANIGGVALATALALMLFLLGRPPRPRGASAAFILQWLICLVLFTVVFRVAGGPSIWTKYVIVTAPSSMLVGLLLFSSLRRRRALTNSIAFAIFMIFAATALYRQYQPPLAKPGDWQRLAQSLSADDLRTPVSVFPAELSEAMRWYLPTPTIPIPGPMPFTFDYVRRTTLDDEGAVARVLEPVRARSPHLWLVTTGLCLDSRIVYYNYHCRYLETYLERRYRLVRSVVFRGSLARLYERSSAPAADVHDHLR